MANEGGTQKGLIGIVLLLVVILVVGFVLWQRDQESEDLNIEIGMGDAETVVEPGPPLARSLLEGIGLSERPAWSLSLPTLPPAPSTSRAGQPFPPLR